jgi:hypothetical protein
MVPLKLFHFMTSSGSWQSSHPLKKKWEEAKQHVQKLVTWTPDHAVLGYADDFTILSETKSDHESASLHDLDLKCSDLGLKILPDKFMSYIYNGSNIRRPPS